MGYLVFCIVVFAHSAVIYVDNNLSDGFWQNAHPTLKTAISLAQPGDEIWVAKGVYTPGTSRNSSFLIPDGIKLYGGFYGGETSLDDRDVHHNRSILSGDIGIPGNPSDNCHHIIRYSGKEKGESILDGFTVKNGYSDKGKGGGGLLVEIPADLLIRNCHFLDNFSTTDGGAAKVKSGVTFENCLFELNKADNGGAVASMSDNEEHSEFSHCTFIKNTASSGSALNFRGENEISVNNCVFWMNKDENNTINSIYVPHNAMLASVKDCAFDDSPESLASAGGLIHYSSKDNDGPFQNSTDYSVDEDHGIPGEWGWYTKSSSLVLNIRVFLEGAF